MTKKATTAEQFEVLVGEMETNPDIARGGVTFGSSKADVDGFWEATASKINGLGPPSRTHSEWRKVWTDFKGRLKKKLANNRLNCIQTGGGPSQYSELTPMEQTVDKLVHINTAANPSGNVYGIKKPKPTPSPSPPTKKVKQVAFEEIDSYLEVEILDTFSLPSEENNASAFPTSTQETPCSSKNIYKRKKNTKANEKKKFLEFAEKQVESMDKMTSAMEVLTAALNAHSKILEKILDKDQ